MHYSVGPDAINQRPELASLVGQCIAMWSDVELQMALSLGAVLKTNSDAAVALFLAIRTSRTQRDALSTVARVLLIADDLDAFEALLVVSQESVVLFRKPSGKSAYFACLGDRR